MDNLVDASVHLQTLVATLQAQGGDIQNPGMSAADSEDLGPKLMEILQGMQRILDGVEESRLDLLRIGVETGMYTALILYSLVLYIFSQLSRLQLSRRTDVTAKIAVALVFTVACIAAPDWVVDLLEMFSDGDSASGNGPAAAS